MFDENLLDEKNNLVSVTIFESYLARFVLDTPDLFQPVYAKVLTSIEEFLRPREENKALERYLQNKSADYDIDRHVFSLFSRLNDEYPGRQLTSFNQLRDSFYLPAADYFIKLIADDIFSPEMMLLLSPPPLVFDRNTFFRPITPVDRRSPYNPLRPSLLFNEQNRGVVDMECGDDPAAFVEPCTQALGIIEAPYCPMDLAEYFSQPIYPARFLYKPKEDSYVAQWLRARGCPVISGASGSTEMMFSRILPLTSLEPEEVKTIIFAQACNMIANGHHSFFEAMLVADHFGYRVMPQATLLDFYLQCVPDTVRSHPAFQALLRMDGLALLPRTFSPSTKLLDDHALGSVLDYNAR